MVNEGASGLEGDEMRRTGVWFAISGVLTTIRAVIGLSDPVYWSPVSALDYSAAVLQSFVWLAVGWALFLLWRTMPSRRGSVFLLIGAVGAATLSVANFLEDVLGFTSAGWIYLIGGGIAVIAILVAGVLILTVRDPLSWAGLFLVLWFAGGAIRPDWGDFVSGGSLLALGVWLLASESNTQGTRSALREDL
jgi:hypothetical protein